MLSITKTRNTVLATMGAAIIAASFALVGAGPAEARLVCNVYGSVMRCHEAERCYIAVEEADGTVTYLEYRDGETEHLSGKNMKCEDGKWVALISGKGPALGSEPPKSVLVVTAPPSTSSTPSKLTGALR